MATATGGIALDAPEKKGDTATGKPGEACDTPQGITPRSFFLTSVRVSSS
jgi:hypothetical protein